MHNIKYVGSMRALCLLYVLISSFFSHDVGFLQLAGGTNAHTVDGLRKQNLFQTTTICGKIFYLKSFDNSNVAILIVNIISRFVLHRKLWKFNGF